MKLVNGQYEMSFENGGVQISKNGKQLYFNARPVYVSVKTIAAVSLFSDVPYECLRLWVMPLWQRERMSRRTVLHLRYVMCTVWKAKTSK